ncbi:hypothetical protein HK104_008513 [Borealophlyctis nickersoniae]|nr:hypothetical protein HK104_008513 [Borealophlyctis nickersoniae]
MSNAQLDDLERIEGVSIRFVPWEKYPPFVRERVDKYAWKAVAINDAFRDSWVQGKGGGILWLDSGVEVRSAMEDVYAALRKDGAFFATQGTLTVDYTHKGNTLVYLNTTSDSLPRDLYHVSGGFYALLPTPKTTRLLTRLLTCSINEHCIAPETATLANHKFDQSVLTVLVHMEGLPVHGEEKYRGNFGSDANNDEDMVVFARRWHCPKPYLGRAVRKTGSSVSSSSSGGWRKWATTQYVRASAVTDATLFGNTKRI